MRPELETTLPAPAEDPARTATAHPSAPPPAGAELPAGLRLGHFQIERKLGAGGMGVVYLANDLALDRPVAIKVLPGAAATGTARERMIREARAQARVQHPNVAHIYFIGEEEGRLYFAMEYLAGETLAERVDAGPVPVEEALAMIRAAALGLREAQRSGFTHRDIKPSNLMVDPHGTLKVLDFGLVAVAPQAAAGGPVAQTTFAGTPLYMSPEQARGQAVDFRADIYALGATLFHLVSGHPPFQADTAEKLLTLHAEAARPALPRGGVPRTQIAAIDALIAQMMAPRPEDRFASYDELLRAIELVSTQYTRPAGLWARSIATLLDVLAVAIVVTLLLDVVMGIDLVEPPLVFGISGVFVWIAIARWGTTPGKALFELEVIDVTTGRRPSWGASARRAAVLAGLPTLGALLSALHRLAGVGPDQLGSAIGAGSIPLLGLLLLHAALRVPGKRAPWDRAAGTMVRYRTARPAPR